MELMRFQHKMVITQTLTIQMAVMAVHQVGLLQEELAVMVVI